MRHFEHLGLNQISTGGPYPSTLRRVVPGGVGDRRAEAFDDPDRKVPPGPFEQEAPACPKPSSSAPDPVVWRPPPCCSGPGSTPWSSTEPLRWRTAGGATTTVSTCTPRAGCHTCRATASRAATAAESPATTSCATSSP